MLELWERYRRIQSESLMTEWLNIVVVTYNSREVIGTFLSSLSKMVLKYPLNVYTLITDNASEDGTDKILLEALNSYPELNLDVKFSDRNMGLSRAVNQSLSME